MPAFWVYEPRYLERFSRRFQWLPCEVKFVESSEVEIISYINNLHPDRFKSLYSTIGKLISLAIKPWNDVLIKSGRGGHPARILTWGVEWDTKSADEWPSREALLELENDRNSEAFKSMVYRIREYLLWPETYLAQTRSWIPVFIKTPFNSAEWEEQRGGLEFAINAKWKRLRKWEHPEPGISFTYPQWKAGHTSNAIVKRPTPPGVQRRDPDHEFYSVSLEHTFKEQDLQVIVKLASIELTPDKPSYEGGSWDVDGMLNEHIAATAIYYYDVSNLTTASVSFRQATMMDADNLSFEEDLSEALAAVFGIPNVESMEASLEYSEQYSTLQKIGSISTPEGRLLAWPNTLQHKFEPFQLADDGKPGHARFIVLSLVDPHYRICSTRNVPPQRHDWWAEEALKKAGLVEKGIPQEVVDMIRDITDNWPMGMEEANDLRKEMMEESQEKILRMKQNFGDFS
jgi:hypothetical protein